VSFLLPVFAFGNCAYDVASIVATTTLERRMIVTKDKSGNKKERNTNFVVIIKAQCQSYLKYPAKIRI
jgi:hypothetical protein